uniref:Aquaporin-10 n=1 Tax=Capra hircus TaxID=9925 RepID=A0A8C2XYP5_CAPHI
MPTKESPVEVKDRLQIRSLLARQCLAEFLAVSVLMLLIQGSSAQAVTRGGTKGNFFTVFLAGSPGVMLATYVSGNVSGEEDPAFSLPMRLRGHLPWARFLIYSLVQLLSVFCASGVPYALYDDALQNYTGGSRTVTGPKETASIFATYPVPYLSLSNGFLDHVLGTWMLMVGKAILDTWNKGAPAGLEPVVVGLLILAITPRLFAYIAGWGPEVFSAGNGWWWVPVVGPLVGGMLGTHHPEDSEPSQDLECAQQEASGSGSPAATQLQESKLRL